MITQYNVEDSNSNRNGFNVDNSNEEDLEESGEESNKESMESDLNQNNNQLSYQPTRGVLILKDNASKTPRRSRFNRSRMTESHSSQNRSKFVRVDSEISNEKEVTKNIRQIIDRYMSVGKRNLYLQIFLKSLTTINFIFYIACTYRSDLFYYLNYADIVLCILYFFDYLLHVIVSHHFMIYIISIESIINLLTMIPPIFFFLATDYWYDYLYVFINITRVLRVLRIFRIFAQLKNDENNVSKHIMMIVITLLQVILISAGVVQLVEYPIVEEKLKLTCDPLSLNNLKMRRQFHHYLYFVVVTVSTVGYGDIYPFTPFAKAIFMIIILIIIVLIPYQTNDLIQLMSAQSDYARHTYKASKEIPHIILTGDISLDSLRSFCQELFHPDHGTQFRHAVIICNEVPTREMEIFLNDKLHEDFIFYLQGNPLNEKDLLRADAPKAKACIVFNNKNSKDPHTGDHQSLFLGIYLKKFVYNYNQYITQSITDKNEYLLYSNQQFRLCMQLNKPESPCHYYNTLQHMYKKRMKQDQLIVIESIKMNLLSKSCLTPGIMALITNLVMSSGSFDDNNDAEWMKEYVEGRGHEIYRIQLLNYYKKMSFMEVVKNIYNQDQAITFALEIEIGGVSIIKLNPTSTIKLNDLIIHAMESLDKTKDNPTGDNEKTSLKKENSLIQDLDNSSHEKIINNIENTNVRLFAYLICSDKSVADAISNKEKEQNSTDLNQNGKDTQNNGNNGLHSIVAPISHVQSIPKFKDNLIKGGFLFNGNQSDSDSDDNMESDNDNKIQFGSSDLDYNRNDYYFNLDTDHYLKNNIEIMHHSIKDREDIVNHIIICGLHPALVHFILPLRARYLQEDALKWIVILAPSLPQHLFEAFTKFPRIIFIQGSPLLPENLFRANIVNADKAVILSSGESKVIKNNPSIDYLNTHFNSEEQMLDAETIFIYKAIKKCNKSIQIMTELVFTSNIEYLLNTTNLEKLFFKQDSSPQYEFTPIYASGEVFTPSIIDRITCQSYYNPHIITIIDLILGGDNTQLSKKTKRLDDLTKLGGSNLYLVKIPEAYVNESFCEFFYFLIHHHHSIGIALYRKNIIEDFYYVYTNPRKTTLLRDCDFVFVLSNGNSILDLIDERPVAVEVNEVNNTNTSESEDSFIEEEGSKDHENLKDSYNIGGNQSLLQPKKKLNELKKNSINSNNKSGSRRATDHESILTQLNKLEMRKRLIETSKHAEIERLQQRLDMINKDLKNLKTSFDTLPQYIEEMIDKEFQTELMVYLSKS